MKNEKNRINELAPCGIYCGACPSFNKSCKGCSSEKEQDRRSKWNCKIRICCYEKNRINYCLDCKDFPCKLIHKKFLHCHPGNPQYAYRHEIASVFLNLKTMDTQEFLDFQKKRWECDSCGGTIHFYYYKCDACGKEQRPATLL